MLLVVAPFTVLIDDQMESCKQFGLNSCKLDTNRYILFNSPETLENHYELISSLSENIFGVVVDESHCVVTFSVYYFSSGYAIRPGLEIVPK